MDGKEILCLTLHESLDLRSPQNILRPSPAALTVYPQIRFPSAGLLWYRQSPLSSSRGH